MQKREDSVKLSYILAIAACSIIVCAMFGGVVSALSQDEATASVYLTPQAPAQGGSVSATIFFVNNSPDTVTISYIGLHFDWMDADSFVGRDLSAAPVTVPSGGSYTFDPMLIIIQASASVGTHSYFIGIDGMQGESTPFSWNSQQLSLLIQGSDEQTYTALLTVVEGNITKATNAGYKSPEAQSLLEQAQASRTQAVTSATAQDWSAAVSALQDATTYLDQAVTAEKNYTQTQGQQSQLLIIVAAAAVAAVVAVLLVLLMVRRRKKQPQTSAPAAEQPVNYEI
jgi:flagellar basal body-associated protein FliL